MLFSSDLFNKRSLSTKNFSPIKFVLSNASSLNLLRHVPKLYPSLTEAREATKLKSKSSEVLLATGVPKKEDVCSVEEIHLTLKNFASSIIKAITNPSAPYNSSNKISNNSNSNVDIEVIL